MATHVLKVLFDVFYYICLGYFVFIQISYVFLKYIRKDNRFENVGFFKYFESPVKTLKGDK